VAVVAASIGTAFVPMWLPARNQSEPARRVLFYRDPMHPSYTSSTPGKAPDCGMDLQPVFADSANSAPPAHSLRPGMIHLDRQQSASIGLSTAAVRSSASIETWRTIGRVEVDETRLFPVKAGGSGTVLQIAGRAETGSQVRRGQPLVTAYGRDYTTAQRAFLYALRASENSAPTFAGQPQDSNALSLEEARRDLRSIGFDDSQIERLSRTRNVSLDTTITAPADGTIITRNVFPQLRFEHGAELFVIADLRRVWISVEASGHDAYSTPGTLAKILLRGAPRAPISAAVADTLPRYDGATRTARVRLNADNPGFVLKPGMFVDVVFEMNRPEATTVPTGAITTDGLGQIAFVDLGDGFFERRRIETGWRVDGNAQVLRGLKAGESVAVDGSFLLESEHRIRDGTTDQHD
jgi:membrane fusion protein, copper/silver efflux system